MIGQGNEMFLRRAVLQADKRIQAEILITIVPRSIKWFSSWCVHSITLQNALSLTFVPKVSQKFQCVHPFRGQEHETYAV